MKTLILTSALLCALASSVHGVLVQYFLPMTVDQEPHSVDISAPVDFISYNPSGLAILEYDTVSKSLLWEIQWSGLTGPTWGLHFHEAPSGTPSGPVGLTGGIAIGIFTDMVNPMPSVGSVTGGAPLTPDQVVAFTSGQWYLNLHTDRNGPGEIRANIPALPASVIIPEPAVIGLLGMGLLGLFVAFRRRG